MEAFNDPLRTFNECSTQCTITLVPMGAIHESTGVSRITKSGLVYCPLDAEKVPTNTSKGKTKVNIPIEDEVDTDLGEPYMPDDKGGISNEEPCEFLKFIKHSEYKLGKGLGKFGQGIESIVIPQGTKDRHGLGYNPTQKDWGRVAEEKWK
ncbi:hypothetical protein Lal_00017305 [Lupinus albus]|nr:hypothetical protein Lal_00017305 [Lupinus albus]